METKKTKKADLEKNRTLFLELGLLLVLSIILIAFEWTTTSLKVNVLDFQSEDIGDEELTRITRQKEKQLEKPPPPPIFVEVINIVANDEELIDQLDLEDQEADPDLEMYFIPYEEEEADEEIDFYIVEEKPKFKGGDVNAFRKWIKANIQYPEIAAIHGVGGKVFMEFAINSKGQVVDVEVIKGADPALDKEALRVVNSSPRWEPGKQRGKPVKVRFRFPINFVSP